VPNIMSLGVCLKNAPRQIWCIWLIQHQNLRYFRRPTWNTKSW